MRKSLSYKVFWLFAPLTLLSILFGAVVLYGYSALHEINQKTNLLKDFQLQLKQLETHQPHLATLLHTKHRQVFEQEIKQAEKMADKLVLIHPDLQPELVTRLEKIPFFMANYSRAYQELYDLSALDKELPQKNVVILDKLHKEINASGAAGNKGDSHKMTDLLQEMMLIQARVYHDRKIEDLPQLKKIMTTMSQGTSLQVRELVEEFGNNIERNYINFLELKNREAFLKNTGERFFEVAAETLKVVARKTRTKQIQFIWTIFFFIVAVIVGNLITWRLSSNYIKSFLKNHRQAMDHIKNGQYDFSLPTLPQDEIGDLTRTMQNLGMYLKESLEKLAQSEEKYRDLVDNLSDWLWEVDEKGKYVYASKAVHNIIGYQPDEMIGKCPFDFMRDDEAKRVRAIFLEKARHRQPIVGVRNIHVHKDGHEVILETSGQPIIEDDGRFRGYRGVDRDITDRERALEEQARLEEQLVQAQKMESVGRLAGGVAHDFNNILTAINGYAELILREMEPDNLHREEIAIILESGQRAARLTQQLLAFSRKQIIKQERIDLNKELQEIHKMLERLISEDIEIKNFYGEDIWPVKVDRSQLEQVIINLAVNARDAMPHGGKLTIETKNVVLDSEYTEQYYDVKSGEYVMLAVSDNGSGMTRDVLENIFEPFYTTKDDLKGTGLGLATVHGVIKQNGGHINVYSEPGEGTIFKIYLPRAEVTDGKQDVSILPQADQNIESGTVLLVEDNEMVRELCLRVLQIKGYDVLVATNGEEALALSKDHKDHIDLLLTDVVMPKMNGTELADELRELFPGIKVLFMSGYTENAIVRNGVLKGGVNFIHKPLSPQNLANRVQDLLSS